MPLSSRRPIRPMVSEPRVQPHSRTGPSMSGGDVSSPDGHREGQFQSRRLRNRETRDRCQRRTAALLRSPARPTLALSRHLPPAPGAPLFPVFQVRPTATEPDPPLLASCCRSPRRQSRSWSGLAGKMAGILRKCGEIEAISTRVFAWQRMGHRTPLSTGVSTYGPMGKGPISSHKKSDGCIDNPTRTFGTETNSETMNGPPGKSGPPKSPESGRNGRAVSPS